MTSPLFCLCLSTSILEKSQLHLHPRKEDRLIGRFVVKSRVSDVIWSSFLQSQLQCRKLLGKTNGNAWKIANLRAYPKKLVPLPEKRLSGGKSKENHRELNGAQSNLSYWDDHLILETLRDSKKTCLPKKIVTDRTVVRCPSCGRRHILEALGTMLSMEPIQNAYAALRPDPMSVINTVHPSQPEWYEEIFAKAMDKGMKLYEDQVADYKAQLFNHLDDKVEKILEVGIGTGPNIKFYARRPGVSIVGVDPNTHMEKYARAAASSVGLKTTQFEFLQGVGEALPLGDSSFDAIVCTLVLCSVKDVEATLKEVQRVLKPGGSFLFIEHVAAPDSSSLRFWQSFFDPVQQVIADGCHLTRNTLKYIQGANFSKVHAKNITVPNLVLLSPHIIGIAQV